MKKTILSILVVLMLIPAVLAIDGIEINEDSLTMQGGSGTLQDTFTLNNTDIVSKWVYFEEGTLECSGCTGTLSINAIPNEYITDNSTSSINVNVPVGTVSPGMYIGTINATNSTGGLLDSIDITVDVQQNEAFTVSKTTASIAVNPGSSSTTTFGIINSGNVDATISSIVYNSANFVDSDGNVIAINLSKASNFVVAKGLTETITVRAQAPANTNEGTYSGTVTVTGAVQKTFTLSVKVNSVLRITDIDLSSVDDDDEVGRGEELTVKVEYKNYASNIDIDDVEVKVTIMDGSSPLEDDDGDDIEDDESVSDLDNGDKDEVEFTFDIPFDINDGDTYDIFVEIIGENEDDPAQNFYHNSTETIKVVIESHEVKIDKAQFDTEIVSCGDRNVRLTVEVVNIGDSDEDIELIISNTELNIEEISFFELKDEFDDEDDYAKTKSYIFPLSDDLVAGNYNFYITAYYDDNDEKDTEVATLIVASCGAVTVTPPPQTQEDVTVTYTTQTTSSTPTSGISTSPPMSLTDTSKSGVDWEVVGLVVLFAALAGTIVGVSIKYLNVTKIKGYK